jgi:hypothetical protein
LPREAVNKVSNVKEELAALVDARRLYPYVVLPEQLVEVLTEREIANQQWTP